MQHWSVSTYIYLRFLLRYSGRYLVNEALSTFSWENSAYQFLWSLQSFNIMQNHWHGTISCMVILFCQRNVVKTTSNWCKHCWKTHNTSAIFTNYGRQNDSKVWEDGHITLRATTHCTNSTTACQIIPVTQARNRSHNLSELGSTAFGLQLLTSSW